MIIKMNEQQRAGLKAQLEEMRDTYEQMERELTPILIKQVQDYEAQHGVVTPTPKGKEYRNPRSKALQAAWMKRMLIDAGKGPPSDALEDAAGAY